MMNIWDLLRDWLAVDEDRKIEISHGGSGGKWYACLCGDGVYCDGTGDSAEEALRVAYYSEMGSDE